MKTGEALFHDVVLHMRMFPEKWDQQYWAKKTDCGTTMCLAGTTCAVAGLRFDFGAGAEWRGTTGRLLDPYEDEISVSEAAERLLELDWDTSYDLFFATGYCDEHESMITDDTDCSDECSTIRSPGLEEYIAFVSDRTGIDFSNDFPDKRSNPFVDGNPA